MSYPIRQIIRCGEEAHIPLSQGLVAIIDAADIDVAAGRNWYARKSRGHMYVVSQLPRNGGARREIKLHRLLVSPPQGFVVDHIDGNTLNNRRENLRVATSAQNSRNRGRQRNNSVGFKGVFRKKNRFVAAIRLGGKNRYVGMFLTPEAAHQAYCDAAVRLHGEFARFS